MYHILVGVDKGRLKPVKSEYLDILLLNLLLKRYHYVEDVVADIEIGRIKLKLARFDFGKIEHGHNEP